MEDPIIGYRASITLGFYFITVGYYFLLFAYFLVIRFRKTKRAYWLFFATLFLMLAMSGGIFIIHDYYVAQADKLVFWRIASFFGWLAVACIVEILAILMLAGEKKWVKRVKIGAPLIYVGIAIVILLLPDPLVCESVAVCPNIMENQFLKQSFGYSYAEGRFVLNGIILPITTGLFPVLFFYLGIKSVGVIRRSSILNGIGFLLYFLARLLQPLPIIAESEHLGIMLIPPSMILIALLILVIATQFEHLK